MITVEYLVVGKEAEFQRVVGKTLVERMVNGNKLNVRTSIFEDILQSLLLLLTVGQDIQLITFQQIVLQSRNGGSKFLWKSG